MNEVSKALGISARTVARWETGRTAPPPRRRERLREVLAPLPAPLAEQLTLALGLAMPEPPPAPETQRAFVDDRIRVAAERADIRASELRAALSSLVPDLVAHGVSLDTVATALGARV